MRFSPAILILIVAFVASPVQGSLVFTEDFESHAAGSLISSANSWSQTGTTGLQAIQSASWASESGSQGVWVKGWNPSQDQNFHKDSTGAAGTAFTLDAGIKIETNFVSNGGNLEMSLIWLDGSSAEISRETLDVDGVYTGGGNWQHHSVMAAAPTGTATVRSSVRWTTDSVIENGSLTSSFVDNISLTAVPEPTSVALFGTAMLAIFRRRR